MYAAFYDAAGAIVQRANSTDAGIAKTATAMGAGWLEITAEEAVLPLEQTHMVRDGELVARPPMMEKHDGY